MESRALVATLLTSFVTNFLSCGEQLPELKADEYLLPSGAQLNLDDEYGIGYSGSDPCTTWEPSRKDSQVCLLFCFVGARGIPDEYGCVPMSVGKTIETPGIELALLGIYRAGAHIRAVRKPQ